jgi:hypothetical protein
MSAFRRRLGNYDTAGPKLPLRILVQTDSAIAENLAALVAKGDRQQEFGASSTRCTCFLAA